MSGTSNVLGGQQEDEEKPLEKDVSVSISAGKKMESSAEPEPSVADYMRDSIGLFLSLFLIADITGVRRWLLKGVWH